MKNIIFAILVAFSMVVVGCAGNDNTPDMMVFSDSSVDMQVSPDGGVLDDLGTVDASDMDVVALDAGPEDMGIVVINDAGVDAFVPPLDAGPEDMGLVDSDGDGVPDSQDVCPGFDDTIDVDGDMIPDDCDPFVLPAVEFSSYPVNYVWIAQVNVGTYEQAEAACAARGGHVPVFSGGLNNGLDQAALQADITANRVAIQALTPAGVSCPWTASQCSTFPQPGGCTSVECDYKFTNPNGRANAVVAFNNVNGSWTRDCFNGTNVVNCASIGQPLTNINVLCVLPPNGNYSNPGLPNYVGVQSNFYTL